MSACSVPWPGPADLTGLRIGLLSNGKLNAELLLQETAQCSSSIISAPLLP
jgi:hypothetical protein